MIVIKANGVVIFMNVDNIFVSIYLFFYRVLIYGSHAILINLCKNENGKIPFSSASVVLLSEVMKVLNCIELYVTVEEAFFFSIYSLTFVMFIANYVSSDFVKFPLSTCSLSSLLPS